MQSSRSTQNLSEPGSILYENRARFTLAYCFTWEDGIISSLILKVIRPHLDRILVSLVYMPLSQVHKLYVQVYHS